MSVAPRRVYIGRDVNGNLSEEAYPSSSVGLQAALNDGHRWLVFREPDVPFCSTVSLDNLPNGRPFLRLEGSRVRGTNFSKAVAGTGACEGNAAFTPEAAPLLQALNDEWVLEWRGITLVGWPNENADCGKNYSPLMVINQIRDSRFEECAWINNPGRGLYLGAVSAKRVLFEGCEIGHNCKEGVVVENASMIDFVRCEISRNGKADYAGLQDVLLTGKTGDAIKGSCSIRDNHFESELQNASHRCIKVDNICAVDIERNYVALAGMIIGSTAERCRVARNKLVKLNPGDADGIEIQNVNNDIRNGPTDPERNLIYV